MLEILAVVVLYNREIADSQSVASLLEILKQSPALSAFCSLLIYDNSPQPHRADTGGLSPFQYVHDPSNGGLARAYNFALDRAEAAGCPWLLLLDQDTSLTREFLEELQQVISEVAEQSVVGAIVPRLIVNGDLHSPASDFLTQLRHQFQASPKPIDADRIGIQPRHLSAYNSGSTLRVSAMRSIGGFPPAFWLDFLDHAVFHELFAHGYRTYVLRAELQHDFSHSAVENVPAWRSQNVLAARTLYVINTGTFTDRLLYRVWLLRLARKLRQAHKNRSIWKETALQALRLKASSNSISGPQR